MMEMKSNTDRRTDQINIWLRIFYYRSQLFGFTICGHNFQYNMIRRFYSIFFINGNPIRVHLKSRIQSIWKKNWHTEKIEGKKRFQLKLVDVFNHKYWWQTKIPIGTKKKLIHINMVRQFIHRAHFHYSHMAISKFLHSFTSSKWIIKYNWIYLHAHIDDLVKPSGYLVKECVYFMYWLKTLLSSCTHTLPFVYTHNAY